ncbi:hypothetical protein Tco_1054948 [Tanacetum coccineum]|uniref:Uncharacterized protein n=1 Tax=Tanacetum coccineum TaxID=301880 RepID=A0ABQ5GZH6_9ASTR
METKNTSSSGSDLEEPEIQKLQMQAKNLKENSLNKLNALKTTIQHLSSSNHSMYYEFREAFHRLFDANEGLFRSVLSRNMQNLEMQFSNETLHEKDSNSELRAIKACTYSRVHGFQSQSIGTSSGDETTVGLYKTMMKIMCFANEDNILRKNAAECVDERAALANLIANLTLDTEENKTILKQLKKANASLTQELKECRTNLDETGRALGEATSCRDSCLIALQNKQNEFEKYKAFNGPRLIMKFFKQILNQKHDELVKKSLLTKSQLEGYLKENTKVISDLKVKEDKDIDKMIEMDKQFKFF